MAGVEKLLCMLLQAHRGDIRNVCREVGCEAEAVATPAPDIHVHLDPHAVYGDVARLEPLHHVVHLPRRRNDVPVRYELRKRSRNL